MTRTSRNQPLRDPRAPHQIVLTYAHLLRPIHRLDPSDHADHPSDVVVTCNCHSPDNAYIGRAPTVSKAWELYNRSDNHVA